MPIDTETEYASKEEQEAAEAFNKGQTAQIEEEVNKPSASIINDINTIHPETQDTESEFKLTPEMKEKIMEKIKDIDAYGTAFSWLTFANGAESATLCQRLKSVLRKGLLGTAGEGIEDYDGNDNLAKQWVQNTRKWNVPESKIWFNIVGRMKGVKGENQIKKSGIAHGNAVAVTFNTSEYQELPQGTIRDLYRGRPNKHILNKFSADIPKGVGYYYQSAKDKLIPHQPSSKEKFRVNPWQGFTTPFRVNPRLIQGVVINQKAELSAKSYIEANIEAHQDKPEMLSPVYNTNGDLLWPEQIPHQEVQRIVAERKAEENVRHQIDQV